MPSNETVENHLIDSGLMFERIDENMWRVNDEADNVDNIVIYVTGSVVNFRVKLFELPETPPNSLLLRLLRLNAEEMLHGAYGIEGNAVVVVAALEVQNLDLNELQATIDAIALGITAHYPELSKMLKAG
jgi:hypothetical protein